ncbi:MAG TPA: DUF4097 family beta strand repeat-containing protein [Thermomicrobiales bacterium]|nr:DUF4097 family beta strand repeat-containing protein [Thermomicrobiales bacterium]
MSATPFQPTPTTEETDAAARTYSLDLAHPLILDVANNAGNVVIRVVERATLLVGSTGDPNAAGPDDAPSELRVVANGNHVTIGPLGPQDAVRGLVDDGLAASLAGLEDKLEGKLHGRHRGWLPFARWWLGRSVDIRIDIPAQIPAVNLTVVTASGDIDVAGVRGSISARAASGNISLRDAQADLRIDSASGDIRLGSVRGALQAQTASGDLVAEVVRFDRFTFRSASGDLRLGSASLAPGEHRIDTASGDVDLSLETEEGAPAIGVAMTTMSGDARIGPGVTRLRGKDNTAAGFGTIIRVRTMSGDFAARAAARPTSPATVGDRLASRDVERASERFAEAAAGPTPEPPAPPPAPAPISGRDAERLAILRSLERGEISIDEATLRLDAVDASPTSGA